MNGTGVLWWLEFGGETARPHILDQFGWMARMIDEWTRVHGKDEAAKMILSTEWSGISDDAARTAFGV